LNQQVPIGKRWALAGIKPAQTVWNRADAEPVTTFKQELLAIAVFRG
jgi:hypothetical protein